jgi:hypothetical protein
MSSATIHKLQTKVGNKDGTASTCAHKIARTLIKLSQHSTQWLCRAKAKLTSNGEAEAVLEAEAIDRAVIEFKQGGKSRLPNKQQDRQNNNRRRIIYIYPITRSI